MNKGKFTIKNHKKLVIEREGRELQDKKNLQTTKSAMKLNLVVHYQNSAPLNHKKLHSKQEERIGPQKKRRTIFLHEKSQASNVRKNAQSPGRPQFLVRSQSKKMKSCYYGLQTQNGHCNLINEGEIKQKSLKIQILIKSVYQLLRSNQWIFQGKAEYFSMKYEHFQSFSLNIMVLLSLKRQIKIQKEILKGFNILINDLKRQFGGYEDSKSKKGLNIERNLAIFQYFSSNLKKGKNDLLTNISKLTKENESLYNSVAHLRSIQDALTIQCGLKQERLTRIQKELCCLSSNKKKVQEEYNSISTSLDKAQVLYSSISEKEKNILDYVMKQQYNKLIKLVSEDYKLVEADFYQYASYLQANQLATNLDYQSRPFDLIEKELMEEMKEVNRLIIREQGSTIAEKAKTMRDFVLKVVDKFKKKDEELGKLCDFKTKCIKKFVSQMKKWLNNWQLKQEYLVNLRKEFVLDASAFKKKFEDLFSSDSHASCHAGRDVNQILDIMALFNKIQENYKLGNSFY